MEHVAGTPGVEVTENLLTGFKEILTEEAMELVAALQRRFRSRRTSLLRSRERRQAEFDAGKRRLQRREASARSRHWLL